MKNNQRFFSIQPGNRGPELTPILDLSTLESHLWGAATRLVTLDEIRANGANLNIPLYARPASGNNQSHGEGDRSLAEVIVDWQMSSQELLGTMAELFTTLKEMELGN